MEKQKFNQPEFFPRGTVVRIEIFNKSFLFVVESVYVTSHDNFVLRGFHLDPTEDMITSSFKTTGRGVFRNLTSDMEFKYSFEPFNLDNEHHRLRAEITETLFVKTMSELQKSVSWTNAVDKGYSYSHVAEIISRGKGGLFVDSNGFGPLLVGCNLKSTTTEVFSTRLLAIKQFLNMHRANQHDSSTQSKALNRCYRQNRNRILDRRANREKTHYYEDVSLISSMAYDREDRDRENFKCDLFDNLTAPFWNNPLKTHGWILVPDFKLPTYQKYGVKMSMIKLSYLHDDDMCRYFYTQEPDHVLSVVSKVASYLKVEVFDSLFTIGNNVIGGFDELLDFIYYSNVNYGKSLSDDVDDCYGEFQFEDDYDSHWSQP